MSQPVFVPVAVRTRRSLSPRADATAKAHAAAVLALAWLTLAALGWVLVAGF